MCSLNYNENYASFNSDTTATNVIFQKYPTWYIKKRLFH